MRKIFVASLVFIFFSCSEPRFIISTRLATPVVVRPVGSGGSYIWIEGEWFWNGRTHAWRDGYWALPLSGYNWTPGHWRPRHHSWHWASGRWRR